MSIRRCCSSRKANIIQEYPQYKELLFKIEDNELLRGRITFALQCAGYNGDINSNTSWVILFLGACLHKQNGMFNICKSIVLYNS